LYPWTIHQHTLLPLQTQCMVAIICSNTVRRYSQHTFHIIQYLGSYWVKQVERCYPLYINQNTYAWATMNEHGTYTIKHDSFHSNLYKEAEIWYVQPQSRSMQYYPPISFIFLTATILVVPHHNDVASYIANTSCHWYNYPNNIGENDQVPLHTTLFISPLTSSVSDQSVYLSTLLQRKNHTSQPDTV
jgi:hypothetical protein